MKSNSKIKTPIVLMKNKAKGNLTEDKQGFGHKVLTTGNQSALQFNPNFYNQYNMSMPNLDMFNGQPYSDTENIKVCIRIRPLNITETGRGDSKCVDISNNNQVVFQNKTLHRNYGFNNVFNESTTQEDLFTGSHLNVKLC
jgi:hypothetical protein